MTLERSLRLETVVAMVALAACGVGVGSDLPPTEEDQAQSAATSTLVYFNGFETGNLNSLHDHNVGPDATSTVVTSPVATGRYAAKYDLPFRADSAGMSIGNYRSESQFEDKKGDFEFGTEYWVSMNYLFGDWADDTSAESAPFQVHRRPSSWEQGCGGQVSAYSNAPFLMFTQGGVAKIITWHGVVSWSAPLVRNTWQNVVFHFKITWDETGYVEAWKDGVKLFRRNGKLHEHYDDCGGEFQAPYLNIGIYKWDWRPGRKPTKSNHRSLFVDDIKIAKGAGGLTPDAGVSTPGSLVARYRFQETSGTIAADSSGKGNTARLLNGAQFRPIGTTNSAVWLDGDNDYVEAPASQSLNITGNQLTLSTWVDFRDTQGPQVFLAKPSSASAHTAPYFSYSLHGLVAPSLGGVARLTPRFFLTLDGRPAFVASSTTISPGLHHVAGVYDGATMKVYVDGVERGSINASGNLSSYDTPLRLGTTGGFSEFTSGRLDDVRIYTRALSDAEVAALVD